VLLLQLTPLVQLRLLEKAMAAKSQTKGTLISVHPQPIEKKN
jgi:hypothetical protein